jgi:glycerol kinase
MSVLVVYVGTSGVRASVVTPEGDVRHVHYRQVLPSTPMQGFVEFDAQVMADAVLDTCRATLAESGPVKAVGIANQRASTIVWDRATLVPVARGIGWQDLRTVGMCLILREQGIRVAPNKSATKLAVLLDMADPKRERDLCFGTVDTWVASVLSGGGLHVTDHTNAGLTDLVTDDGTGWDPQRCAALNIPAGVLPEIHDSCGVIGEASALPGSPPIAGIAGDQQASLVGQGCLHPGTAKATFGTGGMLDCAIGPEQPPFSERGTAGTFPMVAWSARGGSLTWGV